MTSGWELKIAMGERDAGLLHHVTFCAQEVLLHLIQDASDALSRAKDGFDAPQPRIDTEYVLIQLNVLEKKIEAMRRVVHGHAACIRLGHHG